ncbi:MAG TPA: response regulator [Chloroflexia bacterium]|nr:response regulator [Chloroflexia bacterium]
MSKLRSILLVEDDVALSTVLARHLEALGYVVLLAGTFREAVEQMAIKPALLILDLTLPDASGWDVAQWLESIAEPVPIIIISGSTPDTQHVERFHPVAFLPKPFAIGALVAAVEAQVPHPQSAFGV